MLVICNLLWVDEFTNLLDLLDYHNQPRNMRFIKYIFTKTLIGYEIVNLYEWVKCDIWDPLSVRQFCNNIFWKYKWFPVAKLVRSVSNSIIVKPICEAFPLVLIWTPGKLRTVLGTTYPG